jgi:hypothetical protein
VTGVILPVVGIATVSAVAMAWPDTGEVDAANAVPSTRVW